MTELAEKTSRRVDEVIADRLAADFFVDSINGEELIAGWPDEDVMALANLKLPDAQSERMSELLDRLQEGAISNIEKSELEMYSETYNNATYRKSLGIAEAFKRGLITSPNGLR